MVAGTGPSSDRGGATAAVTARRVCRVAVDVLALERAFDYAVPDAFAADVTVGTIVRVALHGRRVRGWVVADGVEPEAPPERIRPLLGVVSAGPPADVVDLTAWVARRFAGPRLPVLRAASPPAVVRPGPPAAPAPPPGPLPDPASGPRPHDPEAAALAAAAGGRSVAVLRWPPGEDVGDLVVALLPPAGSALVVVPDDRAGVVAGRVAASGRRVALHTSEGRPSERARAWETARGGACVVVGGRSAVFAPVPDLVVAVVVDDGAEALKEERSPAWHARDVALERCRRTGARLVLVSPAPPLEALALAPAVAPSRSAERHGWPVLEVVDRRREAPGLGLFSPRVVAVVRDAVEAGGRAVCVLNRRGRARLLACSGCAELARCERCEAAVAEAADDRAVLACPRCGERRPRLCARCGGTRLRVLRAGVSRARDDLAALLPGVDVAAVEAGTEGRPDAPVLIGTEAVLHRGGSPAGGHPPAPVGSGGHPRTPGVRALAFLDFDQELLAPRFRAGEQALWLLVRAGRLVGPRSAGGRVLVQTRLPRHEVLDAAVRADPGVLAAAEEPRRRLLRLPPFAALARLTGDRAALAAAAAALRRHGAEVSAAAEGSELLARAPSHAVLVEAVAAALVAGRSAGRLRAEVDPLRV